MWDSNPIITRGKQETSLLCVPGLVGIRVREDKSTHLEDVWVQLIGKKGIYIIVDEKHDLFFSQQPHKVLKSFNKAYYFQKSHLRTLGLLGG